MKKGICILGATGSIGVSTLDVVARHPDLYNVVALTANKNIDALYEQCLAYSPEVVVIVDEQKAAEFKTKIEHSSLANLRVLIGAEALVEVSTLPNVDSVMAAIVGAAGSLSPLGFHRCGQT
jgi:1-deoxy-D-xylulose-5-phosphate reductoisomerase